MLTEARLVATFCLFIAGTTTWTHYGWTAALVGLAWACVVSAAVRIQLLTIRRTDGEDRPDET